VGIGSTGIGSTAGRRALLFDYVTICNYNSYSV
jgi:hypothetical protein